MKKLLVVTFVFFFMSIGMAFACPGHHNYEKELTRTKALTNAIVLLETNDKRVELTSDHFNKERYTVSTLNGELLAKDLTKEDLSSQFPELFQALEG